MTRVLEFDLPCPHCNRIIPIQIVRSPIQHAYTFGGGGGGEFPGREGGMLAAAIHVPSPEKITINVLGYKDLAEHSSVCGSGGGGSARNEPTAAKLSYSTRIWNQLRKWW